MKARAFSIESRLARLDGVGRFIAGGQVWSTADLDTVGSGQEKKREKWPFF